MGHGTFRRQYRQRGARARREWETLFGDYRENFPQLATEIDQMQRFNSKNAEPEEINADVVEERGASPIRFLSHPVKCSEVVVAKKWSHRELHSERGQQW
jgi:hypothetical protein